MKRAGGYTTYWTAAARLRLEAARPLDAADASRLGAGTHHVECVEVRWGLGWLELELEGRAGRRIRHLLPKPNPECPVDEYVGRRFRIVVESVGTAEVYVCPDGGLLLRDPDGGVHDVESVEDARQLAEYWRVELRAPSVVGIEPA